MKKVNEYPISEEEQQKQIDHQASVASASKTWLDDVPEGMAPHELDYESEDYEANS